MIQVVNLGGLRLLLSLHLGIGRCRAFTHTRGRGRKHFWHRVRIFSKKRRVSILSVIYARAVTARARVREVGGAVGGGGRR